MLSNRFFFRVSLCLSFFVLNFLPRSLAAEVKQSKQELKIGVIATLTGEFARLGQDAVDTLKLAVLDFEQRRPEFKVKLIVEDDGFSIPKALSAYNKISSLDQIDALVGVSSTAVSAVGSDVRKKNLPMVQVFLETDPQVDSIIQVCPDMDQAELFLGQQVRKLTTGKTVLIVPTNETMLKLAAAFESGFGGGLLVEQVPVGEYDLRALALRVRAHKPERVVVLMGPDQGAIMLRELLTQLESNVSFAFDANFLSGTDHYKQQLKDLSRISSAPVLTLPDSENAEFRAKFKKHYQREVGPWAEYSYDAMYLLLESYAADSASWVKNMHNFKEQGVSGSLAFNAKGIRLSEYKIKTIAEIMASAKP